MKTTRNMFVIAFAIGLLSLQVSGQSPEKAEEEKDVKDIQRELREARIDSAADYAKFKGEAEKKLKENRASISLLKSKKYKNTQTTYANSITKLEIKNQEMEKKLRDSTLTSTVRWPLFKREFNHDMDELGKAIQDMSTKYPK